MAYSADILALSPNHHWKFDGNSLDAVGSANGTDTSVLYTALAIAQDATNCLSSNAIGDRVVLPTTTDINNSAQSRKIVAGWFMATAIQNPPKNIYGEGDATQSFRFILGWGNNVMFEVDDPSFTLQIFGDTPLEANRAYHLCMVFEGNGYANEFKAYLDGVKQLNAEPTTRQPGAATLTARSAGEFGDPAGTVAVGGTAVVLICPINGKWQHWATWDSVSLTDTQIRETLFEKGALPDITISTDTEVNMQTAIDAYASTLRANAPLCIRVEALSGGGDFTLELDNITFDPLASIHIQYTGVDTLTIINKNGSDCSIVSTPNGGTVILKTRTTLTVTVKDIISGSAIAGARAYIEADTGGDLASGTLIMNAVTNASGIATASFDYTSDQPIIGRIRKGSASTYYKTGTISGPIISSGLAETILLILDE